MSIKEFIIRWAGGGEKLHRSVEHNTVDDVAQSYFGLPSAQAVESKFGHTIEEREPLPDTPALAQEPAQPKGEGDEQEQSQEGSTGAAGGGEETDEGGATTA